MARRPQGAYSFRPLLHQGPLHRRSGLVSSRGLRPQRLPLTIVQGIEFLGPGWYCKDRLHVKKTDVFVGGPGLTSSVGPFPRRIQREISNERHSRSTRAPAIIGYRPRHVPPSDFWAVQHSRIGMDRHVVCSQWITVANHHVVLLNLNSSN